MAQLSFRDPDGFVIKSPAAKPVFRITKPDVANRLVELLNSPLGRQMVDGGDFVRTALVAPSERDSILQLAGLPASGAVLEHERVWFPTYPSEWTRGMLREAGLLTLRLAEHLLAQGHGLKDATPWNVLFRGAKPIFVDALSVEPREPRDPLWRPLSQFFSTFVYPLWLEEWTGASAHQAFQGRREGWTTTEIYERLGWRNRLRPRAFAWITLAEWLRNDAKPSTYQPALARDADTARFVLGRLFRRLRLTLEASPAALRRHTDWSSYQTCCHYDRPAQEAKRVFVATALHGAGRVLDLGANEGEYAFLAAEQGARVVAVEPDAESANAIWCHAREAGLDVLPLVMNLAQPTPSTGWRNGEQIAFVDRAGGEFDAVLMLALLHHLTITERIPLPWVLDLAADLTRRTLVIEYVSPEDPYYQSLLRGRQSLHQGDTREGFEAELHRRFHIRRQQPLLEGRRHLYWCEKRLHA
ncbi:MAG: SAM-dependent methyltransferase [Bryobacteraceae bacterium]|nr:SAM-dependent methyltransferase [Bryobacteraceae bacterium]